MALKGLVTVVVVARVAMSGLSSFDQGRTAEENRLINRSPLEITGFFGNSPPLPFWASSYHLRNIVIGSGVAELFLSTLTSVKTDGEQL